MAAPTVALTVVKRFTYRGADEDWSNHYMLTGATPSGSTAWRTLFDALVTQEKTVYPSTVSVVAGYGYDSVADDATAVWSVDLTIPPNSPVPGTCTLSAGDHIQGDGAAWVRWGLDRMNSKGKRIYLRKYFHGGAKDGASQDLLQPGWTTALAAFGGKMRDGTFVEGRVITDRLGTAVVGSAVSPYITTRTLKRRGKRPGA